MWLWIISSSLLLIFLTQLYSVYLLLQRGKIIHSENEVTEKNISKPLDRPVDYEDEMRRTVELQLLRIRNAVQKQTEGIHKKEMELAPKGTIIPEETLKNIYSKEEFNTVKTFMEIFNSYLNRFWYTKNGSIKTVFPGTPDNKDSEAGRVIQRSHELCHDMDILLSQLFRRS